MRPGQGSTGAAYTLIAKDLYGWALKLSRWEPQKRKVQQIWPLTCVVKGLGHICPCGASLTQVNMTPTVFSGTNTYGPNLVVFTDPPTAPSQDLLHSCSHQSSLSPFNILLLLLLRKSVCSQNCCCCLGSEEHPDNLLWALCDSTHAFLRAKAQIKPFHHSV